MGIQGYLIHGRVIKNSNNAGKKPGDEAFTNVPSMTYPGDANRDAFYIFSEATIEKADIIKLQNINFSYQVNLLRLGSYSIKNIDVYTVFNNVAILWRANKLGLDPDYGTGLPAPPGISLGLKIVF